MKERVSSKGQQVTARNAVFVASYETPARGVTERFGACTDVHVSQEVELYALHQADIVEPGWEEVLHDGEDIES